MKRKYRVSKRDPRYISINLYAHLRAKRRRRRRALTAAGLALLMAVTSVVSVAAFIMISGGKIYLTETRVKYETVHDPQAMTLPQIYDEAVQSVVAVLCTVPGMYGTSTAYGSGVVYSSDGYILTNDHCIDGADTIKITTWDNQTYDAVLVATDPNTDLAVLKVEAGLVPAKWCTQVVAGESAIAIGNPLGAQLAGTVTSGIVSSTERNIQIGNYIMTLIQIDVAVNTGNSGGPLLNSAGLVTGIVNSKLTYENVENIGFAIPAATVLEVAEDLIEVGYVRSRPMLGITVQTYDAAAAVYYNHEQGLFVTDVSAGGAADIAGMKIGDKITAIDGLPVSDAALFNFYKEKSEIGETITVTVERDGESLDLTVVLQGQQAQN